LKNLTKIFLFIIWLNQLFGVFGILLIDFDLFLSLSPISLIFTFLIVVYSNIEVSYKSFATIIFIFSLSIISEIIGVNSGLLFGSYYYGENLGYSIYGVPLVIGLNWVVLTVSCGNIASYFFEKDKYLSIFFGSILMLLLDIVMEQVSGNIDFWYFNDESLIFNYITWFLLGACNQYFYQSLNYTKNLVISVNVYLSFIVFFLILFIYLKFFI
tara:strand:- start:1495 stop:2133 length:639 start_codon:yes stop_codon:yes gene_type:complete